MPIASWTQTTQSNKQKPATQKSTGIQKWAPAPPPNAQHRIAAQNAQFDALAAKKPSLMDRLRGFARMDLPALVQSTVQNTTHGSPLETAASIGSGLLDIGP